MGSAAAAERTILHNHYGTFLAKRACARAAEPAVCPACPDGFCQGALCGVRRVASPERSVGGCLPRFYRGSRRCVLYAYARYLIPNFVLIASTRFRSR